jgi:hypothetical protein
VGENCSSFQLQKSFCNNIGPTRTTWALQQIVGYLGYSGRDADVVATAVWDPQATSAMLMLPRLYKPTRSDLMAVALMLLLSMSASRAHDGTGPKVH